jgi:glycosyltransferase involved in cell wall biosynthesis
MKLLHVPFHFFPEDAGGTEMYVHALARELRKCGVESEIAAPGTEDREYGFDDFTVHRFSVATNPANVSDLYSGGTAACAYRFGRILDRSRPDIVHFHAFSPEVSDLAAREAKARDLKIVFTYHIPVTCARGTLLRYGKEVCEGAWELYKCSRCALEAHGAARRIADAVGSLPPVFGQIVAATGLRGGMMTALRMTELQRRRHRSLEGFLASADAIVALSNWGREVLLRNGVPASKLTVARHGVTQDGTLPAAAGTRQGPLRVAFLGRAYEIKGAHILVDTLVRHPALDVALDLFLLVQDEPVSAKYMADLKRRAEGDGRIRFLPAVGNAGVVAALSSYDVLAVPSQWMETGPLVIYDAWAAGIPVIGSNLGGIAELVEHGKNGLLVAPADVEAWGDALRRLSADRMLLNAMRRELPRLRTMATVAGEMQAIYQRLTYAAGTSNRELRECVS